MITAGAGTIEDPGDRKILGNSSARYQLGANIGVNYAGFDLNIMLQGVGKRDVWLGGSAIFPFGAQILQMLFINLFIIIRLIIGRRLMPLTEIIIL